MAVSVGLLIARLILGPALMWHGSQKLFGWFGGHGIRGTGGFFEGLGFRPGAVFAVVAGIGEFVGGLLTLLGFLNPIGPALIISVMLVAMFAVHWQHGFSAANGGYELPLMNIAGALALAFGGPGSISIDAVAPIPALALPMNMWIIIVVFVLGAALALGVRRPAHAQKQQPAT